MIGLVIAIESDTDRDTGKGRGFLIPIQSPKYPFHYLCNDIGLLVMFSPAGLQEGEAAAAKAKAKAKGRGMERARGHGPYFDPDFDSLVTERIPPPRVCIDNDTCDDCTLVKVDSANRHGILLEMVQVLTDLDLVISKSYISSDGGWLMDVFHVTDHLGNKLTDPAFIRYIQQSLVAGRKGRGAAATSPAAAEEEEVRTCLGNLVGPGHEASEYTALELTATDRPGLLSEVSAVLAELGCYVVSAWAWTHNARAACIIHLAGDGRPISDPARLAHIREQVESVAAAHVGPGERWRVAVSGPAPGRVRTERRLHQLMLEDGDYEAATSPPSKSLMEAQVSIESWKERGYSVVNIRSRDRPKLLFDTVCTLTDMEYVVFHAAVSSHGPLAVQEYYIRHMDGCTLLEDGERRKVARCLVAAVERRMSHGLRVEVSTRNRRGLLSDITRAFRESGLSLTRAECTARGERAVGTFYVTDASSTAQGGGGGGGLEVDPRRVEAVVKEIGGSIVVEVSSNPGWIPIRKKIGGGGETGYARLPGIASGGGGRRIEDERPRLSLGSLLWSHIERFSSNFGSIRS